MLRVAFVGIDEIQGTSTRFSRRFPVITIAPRAPEHPRQTDAGTRFGRPSPLSISVLHGSDVRDWMRPYHD